jgi:hypothetical protein
MPAQHLLIRGQWGLGDNIFARPFIRAAAARYALFLETPWPELFEDLNVAFVRAERRLRTQMKNVQRQDALRWATPPHRIRELRVNYGHADLACGSIIEALERRFATVGLQLPVQPRWDLPPMPASKLEGCRRPVAVIRPVTIRTEWRNEARNPRPQYIAQLAGLLMPTHEVVLVADLAEDQEWLDGPLPPHHRAFVHGELDVRDLLALIGQADLVVGGVGFILPAAVALKRRAFIVLGGHGIHNAPAKVTDPRMPLSRVGFAIPENFCQCSSMLHNCRKIIPDLEEQFRIFAERTGLRCLINARPGG